jgi:hypothetical protein
MLPNVDERQSGAPMAPSETAKWWESLRSSRSRAMVWLSGHLPSFGDRPIVTAERTLFDSDKVQIDGQGLAAESVVVTTNGIWAVEFYAPGTIEGLIYRLTNAYWKEQDNTLLDVIIWLRQARDGQEGMRRLRLRRRRSKESVLSSLEMPLPPFADIAHFEFQTVSRSILRLTVFFLPNRKECFRINSLLHKDLISETVTSRRELEVIDPAHRRGKLIAEIREEWRAQIDKWFKGYFPGVFSRSGDPSTMPSCELVVCDGFEVFPPHSLDDPSKEPMLRALEMDYSSQLFEASGELDKGCASVLFAPDVCKIQYLRHHSILCVSRGRNPGVEAKLNQTAGTEHFSLDKNDRFRRTMGLWSLLALLQCYLELVSAAQDQMHAVFWRPRTLGALRRVRGLAARCSDARTVSRELTALAKSEELSLHEGYNFVREDYRLGEEPVGILGLMRRQIERESGHLGIAVGELNEFLNQQANLITAIANLRLQRIVGALAVFGLIVTILALDPVKHWLSWR